MISLNRQRRPGNDNEHNNNIAILTHIIQNTTTLLSRQQRSAYEAKLSGQEFSDVNRCINSTYQPASIGCSARRQSPCVGPDSSYTRTGQPIFPSHPQGEAAAGPWNNMIGETTGEQLNDGF